MINAPFIANHRCRDRQQTMVAERLDLFTRELLIDGSYDIIMLAWDYRGPGRNVDSGTGRIINDRSMGSNRRLNKQDRHLSLQELVTWFWSTIAGNQANLYDGRRTQQTLLLNGTLQTEPQLLKINLRRSTTRRCSPRS